MAVSQVSACYYALVTILLHENITLVSEGYLCRDQSVQIRCLHRFLIITTSGSTLNHILLEL